MVIFLTIPHSGTRWMQGILTKAGYDIVRGHKNPGRHGIMLHWHYEDGRLTDEQWDNPKVGLLRDPLATIISHWRTKENSEVPAIQLWPQRLDEMRRGWMRMIEHQYDTYFFPIENPTGGQKAALEDILGNAAFKSPLDFIGMDKFSNSFPLKDAYCDNDLDTIEKTIPDGLALAREVVENCWSIYDEKGYDYFWWA